MAASKPNNSSKFATSMAELMAKSKSKGPSLARGVLIEGIVTKLTPAEILVDIQAKSEAYVLEKEKKNMRLLLSLLKLGDKVTVSVLSAESDMGYPVVSLRRFLEGKLWEKLAGFQQKNEKIPVVVVDLTKGGCIVETDFGLIGFLPNSFLSVAKRVEEASHQLLGKKLSVSVLELNPQSRKIIFSEKRVISEDEFKELAEEFKVGQKIDATISNITNFGIFADVPTKSSFSVDGLIHSSEITWENVEDPQSKFIIGKPVEVVILGIDTAAKRLDLSIKQMSQDPFEEIMSTFKIDQKVKGTVREITPHAVFLNIEQKDKTIEGMIKKEKIPPTVIFNVGDSIDATVSEFDLRRHRILLVPVLKSKFIGYR